MYDRSYDDIGTTGTNNEQQTKQVNMLLNIRIEIILF